MLLLSQHASSQITSQRLGVRAGTPVCWIMESGCQSDPNQGGLIDGCSVIYDYLLVRLFTFIQFLEHNQQSNSKHE